jgi:hypothetical protein
MLIGKAELPPLKKGMRLSGVSNLHNKDEIHFVTLPRHYTNPVNLFPERLKRHLFVDPSPNSDNLKALSHNAALGSCVGDGGA